MSRKTLLLAPWYFPMKVLRWEDAIKMIYEGTVDVVVEYSETISSPSVTWQMPAVIRLRRLSDNLKNGLKFSRKNIYTRDKFKCQYCGERFEYDDLTMDHVVPKSAGGRRTWTNIVAACRECNSRKADRTCDEAGMWPIQHPVVPKSLPLVGPVINPETAPEEWQGFLGGWTR